MHSLSLLFFACFALAGRVLALNISVSGIPGNITADQFLMQSDMMLSNQCTSQCAPGMSAVQGCQGDNTCLCSNTTVSAVRDCQECYFTNIVNDNRKMPNLLAGSAPALSAYSAACTADQNITVAPALIALSVPDGWEGPVAMHLSTGATIIYLISCIAIGASLITVICTM